MKLRMLPFGDWDHPFMHLISPLGPSKQYCNNHIPGNLRWQRYVRPCSLYRVRTPKSRVSATGSNSSDHPNLLDERELVVSSTSRGCQSDQGPRIGGG